jgi:hypothetical protein
MRALLLQIRTAVVLSACAAVLGCGGDVPDADGPLPPSEMMTDMKNLLIEYQKSNGDKAPGAIGDVMPLEPMYPSALHLLNSNKAVYIWGAPLKASGTAVIAYETAVPDSGGTVLLEDGTVTTMSAADFTTAPKPPTKK